MKNFFNNIMKTLFDTTINDLYGSEEKPKKSARNISIIFLVIFAILLFLLHHLNNMNIWFYICLKYFSFVSFSLSIFAFSSYVFQKKKNMNKFKKLKLFTFISSLICISLSFLPITLLSLLSIKIKFTNFFKHMEIYFITFFMSLIISMLIIPSVLLEIFKYCNYLFTFNINYATILSLLIFMVYQWLTSLFLYCFHKIGKNRLTDVEYKSMKKDFNILVFAEITTITVIANCFVFSDTDKELINGFTNAFAIYIAFDRLIGKWKTLNQNFEQDSKQSNQ